MLAVISPAKTLDMGAGINTLEPSAVSEPVLLSHSSELIQLLRTQSVQEIGALMAISDKLAALNVARFADWRQPFTVDNAKPALYAFRGDVYEGLDADTLTTAQLQFLQAHLRILSGLYGVLRPLDLMQAYRLEMGTTLANARGKNLYAFWGSLITGLLQSALAGQGDDILLNLASNEYFSAVKPQELSARIITPVFKDEVRGSYKIVSFHAKRARGLMCRWLAQQAITSAKHLPDFDLEGYCYNKAESTADKPVFLRSARPA